MKTRLLLGTAAVGLLITGAVFLPVGLVSARFERRYRVLFAAKKLNSAS